MDPNKKIYSVLLIEHELIQKKIMINFLSSLNYQVDTVETIEIAINQIKTVEYLLILLDFKEFDQSCELLIRAARDYLNQKSIIFVVLDPSSAKLQRQYLDLGVDMVFIKPVPQIALKKAIDLCVSNNCIGSNLASQFQVEWELCKKLIKKNPLNLSNKESIDQFISRFKLETTKAMNTLNRYKQWFSYDHSMDNS
ncbi:MAG: response regulator [Gammaproteobacteria bacterium]|nr:MAG: response regulator [Gammaproteobacteria bacterium]